MPAKTRCPRCRQAVLIDEALLGSAIECPACSERFDVPKPANASPVGEGRRKRAGLRCPACKETLPAKSVFCVHCGYDFKLKRRLQSTFLPEAPQAKTVGAEGAGRANPTLDTSRPANRTIGQLPHAEWRDIVAAPIDIEMTLTETIELTMWSLFWVGLFCVLIGCMMFLGTGSIFAVSAVIAGILRVWMIEKDLSIFDLLKIVGALLLGATAIAYPLDWTLPNPDNNSNRVPAFTFELIILAILVAIFLRMISFFFGRYFAIVRRAAFGTMFSEDDRGGLVDLGYALAVAAIGFFPLALVLAAALLTSFAQGNEGGELDDVARWVFVALAMAALCWVVFYVPMATGVVALRHSANPARVFEWIGKSMPDYLTLVLLLLPFHVAVNALAIGAGLLFGSLGAMTRFGMIVDFLYAFFASIVFNQYAMAVSCVAVGRLLCRLENRLRWSRWVDAH